MSAAPSSSSSANNVKLIVTNNELVLDGQKIPVLSKALAERIEKELPDLRALSLNLMRLKSVAAWPTLPDCRRLSMRDNNLSLDAVPLAELGTRMPQLRYLSVSGNKFHSDPTKFADAIASISSLEVVDLPDLRDDARKRIAEIVFSAGPSTLVKVCGVRRDGQIVKSDEEDEEDDEEDDDEEIDDSSDEGYSGDYKALIANDSVSDDPEDYYPSDGSPDSDDDVQEVDDDDDDDDEDDEDGGEGNDSAEQMKSAERAKRAASSSSGAEPPEAKKRSSGGDGD